MGRPNYKFQKRQKELAKQKKKEEKRKRKQEKREEVSEEVSEDRPAESEETGPAETP